LADANSWLGINPFNKTFPKAIILSKNNTLIMISHLSQKILLLISASTFYAHTNTFIDLSKIYFGGKYGLTSIGDEKTVNYEPNSSVNCML